MQKALRKDTKGHVAYWLATYEAMASADGFCRCVGDVSFMWLVMQLIARAATATPPVFCGLAVLVAWWASTGDPEARGVHRLTVWACLAILLVSAAFSFALLASTSTSEVTITPGG
ncbi:hypothetical protein [Streptomyces sp. P17]|uniref:hypothetical protein n=1 Tax=Streptomyces sp. P17 TaxID=3074716 RepID=UPI0028F43541|nr:hypothetical protein [Streptomyces sp. P17]MDT9700324.1 hypothetical protein [Streptomyces sp. P17]